MPYPSSTPANTQSGSVSATSITLSNLVPVREGYDFKGWCLGTVTNTNNEDSCSGTVYNPDGVGTNLTFGIDKTTTNVVAIKAMWKRGKIYMWDATFADCGETMYDNRDGTERAYTTASITAGGDTLCWMTTNLSLGKSTTTQLTADTSNVPSAGYTLPASSSTGFSSNTVAYVYNSESTTCSSSSPCYGYYSWVAAAAGSTKSSGDAEYDICPKGWRLPTSAEYNNLKSVYTTGATLTASPFLGVYSGQFNNSQLNLGGSYGIYWTATVASSDAAYRFLLSSSSANVTSGGGKNYGRSVRCVKTIPATPKITVTFAGSGVSSIKVCKTSGNCSGTNLLGTVSTSGGSVSGLEYGSTYYLYPTFSTGYRLSSWAKTSSTGTLSSTSSSNPTFTMGDGDGAVTITGESICKTFSGYMQDMTAATVSAANVGDCGILTDRRDSKTYTVKKLADNKLWMTENLAIDLTATSYDTLYGTGTNAGKMTNATSQALGYLKGTTTGTSSDQWAMAAVKKTWTSSYSYSEPWIAVDSSTSGVCNSAYCVNSDKSWSSTSVTSKTINGKTSIAQGKIGVYYNYCAASAGSYCWGNGTSDTGSPSSDPNTSSLRDITSDICPYGWRLPTGGSSGEFRALYIAYSSDYTNFQTALSTPLSGAFSGGEAYNQGNLGEFWSSTWNGSVFIYYLIIDSKSVTASSVGSGRAGGLSVRCVFDPPTMQEATATSLATAMPNPGDKIGLADSRDGKSYTIAKLADGKYWMLENLALDLVAQKDILSSSNTNASDTTLGYLKSGGGSSPYTNYAVAAATSTNYYDRPAIATSGTCNNAYCVNNPESGKWKWDAVTSATISGVTSKAQGQIGVYYNYCAASAGSYCYTSSAGPFSDPDTSTLQDVKEDICPKGWRLPTSSDSGEFKALYTAYSSNSTNFQTALSTPLSGVFYSGKAYYQGSSGGFWSSTWNYSTVMYNLGVSSTSVGPRDGRDRYYGYSVRCVFGS